MQTVKKKNHYENKNEKIKIAYINMKSTIAGAIITGLFGIIGVIITAIISNNVGKKDAISEVVSQVNTDTSNVNIHIDTKDDLVNLLNELISKNTEAATENGKLGYSNAELQKLNNSLESEKETLYEENESLKEQLIQYSNFADENKILKEQIASLEDENISLINEIRDLKAISGITPTPSPTPGIGKKVSIFDLDTFRGSGYWYIAKSSDLYTDTYNNEYLGAYYASHSSGTKKDGDYTPIYLLDNKYTICEGQIAWPKHYKNSKQSAWIEFYSGDECIYITEAITADSRLLSFSFSVEGIEKLTIVRSGAGSSNSVNIIYPYLNLVE